MITLRPFIPDIDEHNRLWQLVEGLLISMNGAQLVPVCGWNGAVENAGAAVAAAGGVVPGAGDAGEARVGHWRAGHHGGDDVGVREHPVGADWMGAVRLSWLRSFQRRDGCSGGGRDPQSSAASKLSSLGWRLRSDGRLSNFTR